MNSLFNSVATEIVKKLSSLGKTLSTAESCTGGLIASTITDIPGASRLFLGGMVVYATEMKQKLLGISEETFKYGVISSQMAGAMALKIKILTGSDYSIATTGNLGPETMEGKPEGLIYIAVAEEQNMHIKEIHLRGDRVSNKKDATLYALNLLLKIVS